MAKKEGKIEVEVLQDCAWSEGPFAGEHPKGRVITCEFFYVEKDPIMQFVKDNKAFLKLLKSSPESKKGNN